MMKVFRLVHSAHDPVEKGAFLTRTSSHSHQKIADGIYFALSRDEALIFAKKSHGHTYSHLLDVLPHRSERTRCRQSC